MTERTSGVAVVTGTSRGLGEAIAARLLADGYEVIGISRSGSPGLRGPGFLDLRADLGDASTRDELVERILADGHQVNVLVNNAGAIAYSPCWQLAPETLRELMAVNLTAPFVLGRDLGRHWLATETVGTIVNICSIESEVAWEDPPQAGYALTKGGLAGLTRAMAYDWAGSGIRVNGVAPGIIRTDCAPPNDAELMQKVPLQNRLGRPEDVAGVVSFLCGRDASYMTGEIVYVDGGYRLP
ncbi:SDR family oxidoreductase [Kribbella sancticallisti]|uniref:SDR family oxidoreductase n=1 Tax=Kribbella sancticallisti TaxID=460087 RepID=A0ABP4QRT4_9ACTN